MCCVGKIDELFYTDLDNKIAGVVPDLIGYEKYEKDNLKRINCPNHLRYFNSGMILFDVNKFNENEICKKFFSTLETKKDLLEYFDQDVFNIVIGNNVKYLDEKFNCYRILRYKLKERNNDIRIFHYIANLKPWNDINYFSNDWINYYKNSLWKDNLVLPKRYIVLLKTINMLFRKVIRKYIID